MVKDPHLEVIAGPMFSGKTTELLRRLNRAKIAGLRTVLIRPSIDTTKLTHDNQEMPAQFCTTSKQIAEIGQQFDVVGVDEIQFFDNAEYILWLSLRRVVIVAGLDTTFAFEVWRDVATLMAKAERVDKLSAICAVCGDEATRTQRLIKGQPAKYNDPVVLVGEDDFYEARCSRCWELSS